MNQNKGKRNRIIVEDERKHLIKELELNVKY